MRTLLIIVTLSLFASTAAPAQTSSERAETVVAKAVQRLGGEKYLKVTSQVTRGRYSIIRDGVNVDSKTFLDVIVFPDKEITEFKGGGIRDVQSNVGDTGWLWDGDAEILKNQTEKQVADFKLGIRNSLDHFLRGHWRGKAVLEYVGKREAGLGRRSDVVRVTYGEGDWVEYEFDWQGMPLKAIYTKRNADGASTKEEDRFARFIDVGGITVPFVIDRYSDGKHTSRINFESYEFNRAVRESIFEKPTDLKVFKKDLRP
jgi:hypothetical protein